MCNMIIIVSSVCALRVIINEGNNVEHNANLILIRLQSPENINWRLAPNKPVK